MNRCPFIAVLIAWLPCIACSSDELHDGECFHPFDATPFFVWSDDLFIESIEYGIASPRVVQSPIADGRIREAEYPNRCFFSFAENENPGSSLPLLDNLNDGMNDLTAFLSTGFDRHYLYFGFEVYDDYLDLDESALAYENDGVELFLNPDSDNGDDWGPGKMQIIADAAGNGNIAENNRTSRGISFTSSMEPRAGQFYSAGRPLDDQSGYAIEFQIPLASLDRNGGSDRQQPVQQGDSFLFNFAINDNDSEDPPDSQSGYHLLWFNPEGRSLFADGEISWNVVLSLTEPIDFRCDLNADGICSAADIDELTNGIAQNEQSASHDLNQDGRVDHDDRAFLVHNLLMTYYGDANLDGEFSTRDLVTVFRSGKYETGESSGWQEGDWGGDLRFGTSDLVIAFADGGYETGPRTSSKVPEPTAMRWSALCVLIAHAIQKHLANRLARGDRSS